MVDAEHCVLERVVVFQVLNRKALSAGAFSIDAPPMGLVDVRVGEEVSRLLRLGRCVLLSGEHVGAQPLLDERAGEVIGVLADLQDGGRVLLEYREPCAQPARIGGALVRDVLELAAERAGRDEVAGDRDLRVDRSEL